MLKDIIANPERLFERGGGAPEFGFDEFANCACLELA